MRYPHVASHRFLIVLMLLTVVAAAFAVNTSARSAAVTSGRSSLPIACGPSVQADWYWPSSAPTGVVWLTHGWLGDKNGMAELAQVIVNRTGAVVVVPTITSLDPGNGCWLLGAPMAQAVAQLLTSGRASLQASAAAAGFRGSLPVATVMSGHSAGGNLALSVAGFASVAGVVMFDAAAGAAGSGLAATALASYTGPVLDVASEEMLNDPTTLPALRQARPGQFIGVYVAGGRHLDALGYSNWFSMFLLNDWPRSAANVTAAQNIGADWIRDALTGSNVGIAGTPGQSIKVGDATVRVLG